MDKLVNFKVNIASLMLPLVFNAVVVIFLLYVIYMPHLPTKVSCTLSIVAELFPVYNRRKKLMGGRGIMLPLTDAYIIQLLEINCWKAEVCL